jgi:bifunctional DNase/RNase
VFIVDKSVRNNRLANPNLTHLFPRQRPADATESFFTMPVRMQLTRVIISEINDQQAIYLKEVNGSRTFPILIGEFEAGIINRRLLEERPFRPLTHDFLSMVISGLGGEPLEVVITKMEDHTYFAVLKIRQNDQVLEIDCRPSDAIALSVHYDPHLPIMVSEQVLDEVS